MKIPSLISALLLFFFTAHSQEAALEVLKNQLPSITDSSRYADILNRISMLSYEQNVDSTIFYAKKAREISLRKGYKKGVADATNNLGVYFDIDGNAELALRYYGDAHEQYLNIQDSSNIVQTLMNIAMVYNTKGNNERSLRYYKEAMSLGATLRKDSIAALVIYNFLLQYPQAFAPDSVDFYIEKAVRIAQRYQDIRFLLAVDQLKADRYIQGGRRAEGIKLLEHALTGGLQKRLYYMCLDIMSELGDLYSTTDSGKAVGYYRQALDLTKEKNYSANKIDLNKKLYDFYTARKDKERAYGYGDTLLTLYRKSREIDNQSGIDYISFALKDQELDASRQKAKDENRLLWLEGIACSLALLIIVILYNSRRQRDRIHVKLEEQYKKLATTTTALEASNRNYARLIRVVAHDLRNPIGAIHSLTEMKVSAGASAKDEDWMNLIVKASSSCLHLITELLETDFEIREETLHKETVEVYDLVQQSAQLLSHRAAQKKQSLITQETTGAVIVADKEKLGRVLDNLVVNAIKFSPEGATININAEETCTNVMISVHDKGIGIPPEIAGKLFQPFDSSVKRRGTAGEQSFGLGLYICRQIMEAHGGRMWFESSPGQGTTFFLSFHK